MNRGPVGSANIADAELNVCQHAIELAIVSIPQSFHLEFHEKKAGKYLLTACICNATYKPLKSSLPYYLENV